MASQLAPTTPQQMAAQRGDPTVLLNRTTEKEGIIVPEGDCDLQDPSFGDAARRLECLELEDFEDASSRPSSSRSLKVSGSQRSGSSVRSLRPGGGGSSKSATSPRLASTSSKSLGTSPGVPSLGTTSQGASSQGPSERASPSLEVLTSVSKRSGSLPPGSPFGCEEYQSASFPGLEDGDAASKLKALGDIDSHLMAGLQSLTPDELTLYMQLTEQLASEGLGKPASPQAAAGPAAGERDAAAEAADPRLADAVRQLKARLPKAAIEQLQSHASYGLLDVIRGGQPVTPPPTPTAGQQP